MTGSDPRRGVVLVTVLWTISLLSALAMAASVTFRGYAGVMAVERDRVQGEALLTAGLETAAGIIDTLGDAPLADIETTVNLGTGAVRARLNDEGGRIDIGKAPVELLAAMLRSVGAPPAAADNVAQRIVERRDPGRKSRPETRRSPSGPTRAAGAGQPFSDIGQLQSIPGMAPDWFAAMAPLDDRVRKRNREPADRATGSRRGAARRRPRADRCLSQSPPQLSVGCGSARANYRAGAARI